MAIQVTVTGKNGPGLTLTSAVFTNLSHVEFDTDAMTLAMFRQGLALPEVDINGATTLTGTISGTTMTFVVS